VYISFQKWGELFHTFLFQTKYIWKNCLHLCENMKHICYTRKTWILLKIKKGSLQSYTISTSDSLNCFFSVDQTTQNSISFRMKPCSLPSFRFTSWGSGTPTYLLSHALLSQIPIPTCALPVCFSNAMIKEIPCLSLFTLSQLG
jgi:hypothetical protein